MLIDRIPIFKHSIIRYCLPLYLLPINTLTFNDFIYVMYLCYTNFQNIFSYHFNDVNTLMKLYFNDMEVVKHT